MHQRDLKHYSSRKEFCVYHTSLPSLFIIRRLTPVTNPPHSDLAERALAASWSCSWTQHPSSSGRTGPDDTSPWEELALPLRINQPPDMMLQKGNYRVTELRLEVMSADHTVQPTCSSKVMQSRSPGPCADGNLRGWRLHGHCGQPVTV